MNDTLIAGTRALEPGMATSAKAALRPAAEVATGPTDTAADGAVPRPAIDWSVRTAGSAFASASIASKAKPAWQHDFVSHLAQDALQRQPNLGLRLLVAPTPKLTASLSSLSTHA